MIATGVKPNPPKFFQVLEFIGHQETSSGCGLMGLGEKMLSRLVKGRLRQTTVFHEIREKSEIKREEIRNQKDRKSNQTLLS